MKSKLFVLKQFQLKELTKYSLDISKIFLGSLVIKLFEIKIQKFTFFSVVPILFGLLFSIVFLLISLRISKGVREK